MQKKEYLERWGYLCCPRMVRYAIRLYDGSYFYHSVPFLVGAGNDEWVTVNGEKNASYSTSLVANIASYYSLFAKLISWDIEGWEDIIQSVDIFISTDIMFPQANAAFEGCTQGGGPILFDGHNEKFARTKEEVLSKSNFYLIYSASARNLSDLLEGVDLLKNKKALTTDILVQQEQLSTDYMSNSAVIPSKIFNFNNRLVVKGNKNTLPEAPKELNGLMSFKDGDSDYSGQYRFRFEIRRNNGEEFSTLSKTPEGNLDFYPVPFPYVDELAEIGKENYEVNYFPGAWIAYPDINCYEVVIEVDDNVIVLPMEQHPYLYCSYAFVGLGTKFKNMTPTYEGEKVNTNTVDGSYPIVNQLLVSEVNNPFIFPAGGRFTFQSNIVGIATATAALSQGQFGQFPLYVFTEDGVWVMEASSDGSFVSSKPLSRDVCTNSDSITSIDNAVVFVTAKGVMMIQGSEVVNISPNMNGRHYILDNKAAGIVETQNGFSGLINTMQDEDSFMSFISDCKIVYDYPGQRVIFTSPLNEEFQYVYKLDTHTWHKVSFANIGLVEPINSYPECWVNSVSKLRDNALLLENSSGEDLTYQVKQLKNSLDPIREYSETILKKFLSCETPLDINGFSDDDFIQLERSLYDFHVDLDKLQRIKIMENSRVYSLANVLNFKVSNRIFAKMLRVNNEKSPMVLAYELYLDASFPFDFYKFFNFLKGDEVIDMSNWSDGEREEFRDYLSDYGIEAEYINKKNQQTAKGCIISRPFDLGEPDVYKTIKDVRIRGQFRKGAVKYILEGSDDGETFHVITSRRGKSWKMFRIILLADLEPTERISWIDIDYETRFTNRLR